MFRLEKTLTAGLLAVAFSATVSTSSFALEPLKSAPADADFVAYLKVPAILNSPVVQKFIDENERDQIESMAKFIENATDLNVFEDISEIWVFGQVENDGAALLFARGEYNEEKILDMARLNDSYKKTSVDGLDVHYWADNGGKYATFVEDYLIFGGSELAMRSFVEARDNESSSVSATSVFKTLDPAMIEQDAWAMLINRPGTQGDFGDFARGVDLDYAHLNIVPGSSSVSGTLTLKPKESVLLSDYEKISNGLMSAASLLQEEEEVAALVSEKVTTRVDNKKGVVLFEAELGNNEFLEILSDL